jgi:hypothetical protein
MTKGKNAAAKAPSAAGRGADANLLYVTSGNSLYRISRVRPGLKGTLNATRRFNNGRQPWNG